jgi:hypothetical protein
MIRSCINVEHISQNQQHKALKNLFFSLIQSKFDGLNPILNKSKSMFA